MCDARSASIPILELWWKGNEHMEVDVSAEQRT